LAYADDIVLLVPSLRGLQSLLDILFDAAKAIDMSFNTSKSVCMIFNSYNKSKRVRNSFSEFQLAGCNLMYVQQFKYLGQIIDNSLSDDADITGS